MHEVASQVLAAAGSGSGVWGGTAPSWGPFGGLGTQAKTVIDLLMAVGLAVCFGVAVLGASKVRVGNSSRGSFDTEHGKNLLYSGAAGAFIIASLGTLFTIVYGLGI